MGLRVSSNYCAFTRKSNEGATLPLRRAKIVSQLLLAGFLIIAQCPSLENDLFSFHNREDTQSVFLYE